MSFPIYLNDLDIKIISSLEDISNIGLVNKYLARLITTEQFWYQRINLQYNSFVSIKHSAISWREYYKLIRKLPTDSLGKLLGLTEEQQILRLYTEKDVTYGSEQFQALHLLLPKALFKQDYKLVDYLLTKLELIKSQTKPNDLAYFKWIPRSDASSFSKNYIFIPLIKWSGGLHKYFDYFLQLMLEETTQSLYKPSIRELAYAFGKYRAIFEDIAYFKRNMSYELAFSFFAGVAEGGLDNRLIIDLIAQINNPITSLSIFARSAASGNNIELLNILINFFPQISPVDRDFFIEQIIAGAVEQGRLEVLQLFSSKITSEQIFLAMLNCDQDKALTYYKDNLAELAEVSKQSFAYNRFNLTNLELFDLLHQKPFNMELDYTTISSNLPDWFIDKYNGQLLSGALIAGRYDIMVKLSLTRHSFIFFQNYNIGLYKDLFWYIRNRLLQLGANLSTYYDTTLTIFAEDYLNKQQMSVIDSSVKFIKII